MKHLSFLIDGVLPTLFVAFSIGLNVVLLLLLFFMHRSKIHLRHTVAMHERNSQERLRLLRSIIDLCYAYRESPELFLMKFKDRVNFCQLKNYDLFVEINNRHQQINEDERLLCVLLEKGFTQRELCVIFNLKKTSYVYVKYHRILQKLQHRHLHI